MISGDDQQHRLDALLTGIENELFRLDDLAILSDDADAFADIEHVRALVQSRTGAHASIKRPQPEADMERLSSSRQRRQRAVVPMPVPEEIDERRRLLESLVASQPNIPRHVRVAFSANEKPTDTAVDDMVTELVRLGVLKRTDTDA